MYSVFLQPVAMASFVKRPCSEETEDDILRQQEEFMKTKSRPSAEAVRLTRPGDKRKSKSADGRHLEENIEGCSCEFHVSAWLRIYVVCGSNPFQYIWAV